MWNKVEKRPLGRQRMKTPMLYQNKNGMRLYLPMLLESEYTHFDVYSDGAGKIAFRLNMDGAYRMSKPKSGSPSVTVPSQLVDGIQIPGGSKSVDLVAEDGMIILDTAPLRKTSEAATPSPWPISAAL